MDSELEKFNIIRLSRSLSNYTIRTLLKAYGSFTDIINVSHKININLVEESKIKKEIEECDKLDVKMITCEDEEYPKLLKNTDSYPFVLSCRGNIDLLKNTKTLAVVGSRNCSINTFNFSKKISKEISNYGYIVVSGLAKGIDSSAHIGSLENGTIAVLGSGIDVIYPKENEYLYYEILNNNGLIITEFPLHMAPKPENFIMRNRIIAGLSRGVLVVEAGKTSGTMHTVKQALKFNREIMVFPGSPYDERCAGSNKLLQDGATMVVDSKDIISCLESFIPDECFIHNNNSLKDAKFVEYETKENNGDEEGNDNKDENEMDLESVILSKLSYTLINIDSLIDNLDFDLNSINSTLIKLKLENKIMMDGGKIALKFNG
ncbi:MAG: DNA-processing protein DprA [Rickettsiales bacterium]|nr:DNA-processing protein DprA [Rickettsiales bacterium]